MPLTPATLVNSRACASAVLADRRVEHEQHFLRRARHLARRDAPDLVELVHQVDARVQPAGGVDEDRIAALAPSPTRSRRRPPRPDRRPRAPARCRRRRASPRSRAARRRRRGTCRRRRSAAAGPPFLSRFASLPTVVVLPVPLTPTISVTCGRLRRRRPAISTAAKTRADLLFTRSRRLSPLRDALLHRRDDALGRRRRRCRPRSAALRAPRASRRRSAASAAPARRRGGRSRRSGRRSAAWCGRGSRGCGRGPHPGILLKSDAESESADFRVDCHRVQSPRAAAGASAPRPPCGRPSGRRARRPSARRSAARRRSARRARARHSSCCTPSATIFMPARMSASRRPRASSMPTCRLRLSVPVQVSTRSPRPLKPPASPAGRRRRTPAA